MAGDKEVFGQILEASGARYTNAGECARVTDYGRKTGHFRVEDADGKGWWVLECVPKAP